jgi:ubiquinone/menaquinone biosynthesis C-methylase UbiE
MNPVDLDANLYVKNSSLQNNLAKTILCDYSINSKAYILDIGCGDGRITAELAKMAKDGKVIGIDPSPNMIEFASKNFTKKDFSNLHFRLSMAEDINFVNEFDLVVSFSCFHWLKNPKKAVQLINTALKDQGEILILTYPKESPYYKYLQIALQKYPEYSNDSANIRMLAVADYKKVLCDNNFEIFNFEERHLFATYNNCEELKEYIRGWLSSYVCLPGHLHEAFLEDVSQIVTSDTSTNNNGKISIPYTALIMRGKKIKCSV